MPTDSCDSPVTSGDVSRRASSDARLGGGKKFTWEELAQHNSRGDTLISVRGKVYDVSGFVSRHPGGVDQIMLGAGRDATQLFESYHKLETHKVLEKFYVGELVTREYPWFPEPSEFYVTLRQRVDKYFREHNIDPKVDYWMFARYITFVVTTLLCYAATIVFHDNVMVAIPFAVMWGVTSALVAMTCTHDASHFAITHKPWVWRLVGSVHDFYHGASMFCWIHQHTLGHHPFTNIDRYDPDILTANEDVPDIRRIKWGQKWLPRYFYQHVYMPMLYCVLGIKTRLQDFGLMYNRHNSSIRFARPTRTQWAIFFAGKAFHCFLRFAIPIMFMPLSKILLYTMIAEIIGSYWLALIFQVSHVISEVDWPVPAANNFVNRDWAELQIATTMDYATDSWFWNIMTGALNHQTTHHLFPGVIQSHYPKITPIVAETCREFGVPYHYVSSTKEALGCHINHLKRLGQRAVEEEHTNPRE